MQNLMSQLGNASNPLALMMSMLKPEQKQQANQFQNKTAQEQAEEIAKLCNEKGITKKDLEQIINVFKR
jgi:uncharacterized iron-regulated protein